MTSRPSALPHPLQQNAPRRFWRQQPAVWTMWTMWTIARQSLAVRAVALVRACCGQCGQWPGRCKPSVTCVGRAGVGVDLWTMWTMWTMSCKSSTPFGGAGARRPCSHYCISIQYIFFSVFRLSTPLSTLSTQPILHWARTWTTHAHPHSPHMVHVLSIPDYFVGLLHCAKKSFTL